MSQGGAAYFCGKGVDNKDQKASIMGAVAGAHYIRSVAPAYGIPVILHTDHCAKKLLPWLDGMLVVRAIVNNNSCFRCKLTLSPAAR